MVSLDTVINGIVSHCVMIFAAMENGGRIDMAKPYIDPSNANFGAILNFAVRYALGRSTYAPFLVQDLICPLLPYLNGKTLEIFRNDIENASSYGDDIIDKLGWMVFLAGVKAEIERRQENEEINR